MGKQIVRQWLLAASLAALALVAMVVPTGCTTAAVGEPEPAATEMPEMPTAWPIERPPAGPPPLEPIYFETNSAALQLVARATLETLAGVLRDHPEWGEVVVEGHCDERGSETYNHALGERRAGAVKAKLVALGVAEARLLTRSYGEHKPAVPGHGESAWSRNRRSELVVGATPLAAL